MNINTGIKRSIRALSLYVIMGAGAFYMQGIKGEVISADLYAWERNVASHPQILQLQSRMRQRFASSLKTNLEDGTLAISLKGWVVIRNKKLPKNKKWIEKIVKDENKDRKQLYYELANAGKIKYIERDIQTIFTEEWLENAKKQTWWIKSVNGDFKKLT